MKSFIVNRTKHLKHTFEQKQC